MKLKLNKIFSCILFILALSANTYGQELIDFYFADSQPRKEDPIKRFPASIRGLYKSDSDTTRRIRINGDSVVFEMPMIQYASMQEISAKNYTFQDSILITPSGEKLFCMQKNDTVFFVDYVQSVFFVSGNTNVIKKVNEYYVLSKQIGDGLWECFLLSKNEDKLYLAYFDHDNKTKEIEANKRIDLIKSEKQYYSANLKKKDFLKLIDKDFFARKQYFTKRYNWQ